VKVGSGVKARGRWSPSAAQLAVASFLALAFVGSLVLAMPICHTAVPHHYLDDLFVATSATCVTGLATVDLGATYTPFGLVVVMTLMQAGALGYMTMFSLGVLLAGRRLSLRDRMQLQEATELPGLTGIASHIRDIARLLLVAEAIGAALLATQTVPDLGWGRGLFAAVFYAVGAPTNAGFSFFADGFVRWSGNPVVLLTVAALTIYGGLGYTVVREAIDRYWHHKPPTVRWMPLVRIVGWSTGILLVVSTVALWALEHANARTLGPMPFATQWLDAFFMAVQTRSGGFNTVDVGAMTGPSLILIIGLMFVGTGPGGTGGGIKLTTVAILLAIVASAIRADEDVNLPLLRRRVEPATARKAVAAVVLSLVATAVATFAIATTEALPLLPVLFEVTSAFGTTGLSMGVTSQLHAPAKAILIAMMLAGRVGLLTLTLALFPAARKPPVRYAEESVLVG
jgi:trk system potassium uptake protein TrkH